MTNQEILKYIKNPALLSETTLPRLEQLVQEYPWFQTGWVLYAKNLEVLKHEDYNSVLNRTALMVPDRKWLKNFIDGNSKKVRNARISEEYQLDGSDIRNRDDHSDVAVKSDKTKLIEDFLEKGGTFKTMAAEDSEHQSVDLAANAVAINDEIVTEKFANLLVRQKKYEEAINAIEKLSLKFPEKSIYFATRIEEVKILMNVNKE
jgi:hypothetical protein